MQPLGDLRDAFSELNINIPNTEEEQQEYLLPQWKDITEFLDRATEDFDVGQLVHLQSFTLFDAMSAIEIMDPRMDTGMIVEDVQKEFDITEKLSPKQTLGIMDGLISREMAWISGHSLSQTVYTCIYFHHIQALNDMAMPTLVSDMDDIIYGVLKSYVLATIKCCHYIWTEMTLGNVFEEEDFTTNLFGLSFNEQNADVVVFNDLDSSIMLLNHLLNTNLTDDTINIVNEILARLTMRKSFLLSLVYLSQSQGTHLHQAKSELTDITNLLKNVDLTLGRDSVDGVFDSNINRRLTSQTPPRPVELKSNTESFHDFDLLVNRLISVCDVNSFTSVTSLVNYFDYFGSNQPYADAFTRSKLNTLFFHDQKIFGSITVPKMILSFVKETVGPPPWWLSVNQSIPKHMDYQAFCQAHDILKTYLNRISMVFVEYFRINCHNRSRQRRMLCKMVVEWEILQEEAAGVDEVFHALQKNEENEDEENTPYYFSTWAYSIKLSIIEKILFLGFELDLYGSHEYIMIYWYIQCVLGSRAYLLERIANFLYHAARKDHLYTDQYLTHAKKSLSEAMLKILLSAKHTCQWNQRKLVFDDEHTRYLHRFKSFIPLISPPHPSYDLYLENIQIEDFDVDRMKQVIKQDLYEAKRALDGVLHMSAEATNSEMCHSKFVEEIKNLLRITVATGIGLVKIEQKDGKQLETVYKYHTYFPIVTEKK